MPAARSPSASRPAATAHHDRHPGGRRLAAASAGKAARTADQRTAPQPPPPGQPGIILNTLIAGSTDGLRRTLPRPDFVIIPGTTRRV
jgi:hypothetical protein